MASRIGALTMFLNGLKVVVLSLPLMLPIALLNGMAFGYVDVRLNGLIDAIFKNEDLGQSISQVFAVVSAVLGLYLILQITKRKTASWISWIPTLFLPGSVLIAALVASKNELAVSMGLRFAIEITWMCTVGGLIYGLWVCLSYTYAKTGTTRGAVARWRQAGLGYLTPHGGSTLLIYLGMQFLFPGLIFAVIYSFVDHAAILKPDQSPYRLSNQASTGLRRPIVWLFMLTLVPATFGRPALTVWSEQLFHSLGWSNAFVQSSGAFEASGAWENVIAMFFGAPWSGAFYSEGLAMTVLTLMVGVAASGLTWAFLSRVAITDVEPHEETVE